MDWAELYKIATSDEDGNAEIILTDSVNEVILRYKDGSENLLYWKDTRWEFSEQLPFRCAE